MIMAWTTPILIEICIGLEINGHLPAEFWSGHPVPLERGTGDCASACSGAVGTSSPIRTCANQEFLELVPNPKGTEHALEPCTTARIGLSSQVHGRSGTTQEK